MPFSQSQKLKIAEELKPISKEDAEESYLDLADEKTIPPNTSLKGNKFVDYFTFLERLETTGKGGMSFWEFWDKKSEYMKKNYVKNLLAFYKKNGDTNILKQFFKIFQIYFGSISIFKPVIAMNIYHRFKPRAILDFTMGWGGRLVGAAALDIPKYTGIDLNKNLEKPYREMEKTLKELGTKTNIKLIFQDALKVDYSKIDYDMVFTSPPYYNVEIYRGTNKLTEEEWNENFYRPLFEKTWKYLKNGGHYILNVPIAVYDNVLVDLLGKADILIPMLAKRNKKNKAPDYKEYIYVWIKNGKKNISNNNMKSGKGIETDLFDEEGIVSIPEFRSVKLDLPTFMYKRLPDSKGNPPPYRYKLIIPITKSRNLSSRKMETSLNLSQKPVSKPIVQVVDNGDRPTLNEFSPADREKIKNYYSNVKENEENNPDDIEKDYYQVVPRGYPLPCEGAEERKDRPTKAKAAKAVRIIEPKAVKVAKPQGSLVAARVANIEKKTAKAQEKEAQPKNKVGRPKKQRKKVELVDDGTDLFASLVSRANAEDDEEDDLGDEDAKLMLTDYEAWKRKNLGGRGLENKISTNNKMPNKWITYVKEYASKNGMNYRDALKDPKCKAGYKTGGMLETTGHQSRLLAQNYNDSELGANAGKKYISL